MLKKLKNRFVQFALVCIVGFTILAFQLAYLTVERGQELYIESLNRKKVELKLRGRRGRILDRYGIPVAINRHIYVVQLNRQQIPTEHQEINGVLKRMLEIIESNGDNNKLVDNIPLKIRYKQGTDIEHTKPLSSKDRGEFYYIWEDEDPETRRKLYNRWAKEIGVKEDLSPEEMMDYLRARYKIDDSISDSIALKIAAIRLDIYMKRYTQFEPIPVATGVSQKTVVQLETFGSELPGVQTRVESGRYYPMGETISHIVGYTGSIGKDQADEYVAKGYDLSKDKIGQAGVEAYAEQWLTGSTTERQGVLVAEVDSSQRVVRVLDEKPPRNGDDVILTIDSQLQNAIFSILKEEITKMREGKKPYDGDKMAPLAQEGAAVVLDVNTGEALALVSYPSFDPNTPAKTGKQFALAFQGGMIPGSVFKMLVGIAGLMEDKITIQEEIRDHVRYTKYDKINPPKCWRPSGHGKENIVDAIKHSCNYYFYELADRLGIDAINKWARLYGLDGETGLEILSPEGDKNIIPSLQAKINTERSNMWILTKRIMQKYGYIGSALTEQQKEHINRIIDFQLSEDRSTEAGLKEIQAISDMLKEMGYSENSILAAEEIRRDVLANFKRWKATDTVMTGIGQRYTVISPLAVSRYIAALVNGGKVLETHVVKQVVSFGGEVLHDTKPKLIRQVVVKDEYIEAIHEGMWRVVNDPYSTRGEYDGGGTAASYYADIDPSITLGGKTGTAELVATDENRNYAWFVAFTPYEKPEIVVVVAIPNGRSSTNAAPVARKIIEEYYRQKNARLYKHVGSINQLRK